MMRCRFAFVLVVLLPALASCVAGAPEPASPGVSERNPPPPLPEIQSAAPAPGMVWVPGAWHDDGSQYVWIPGRWESPPPSTSEP